MKQVAHQDATYRSIRVTSETLEGRSCDCSSRAEKGLRLKDNIS